MVFQLIYSSSATQDFWPDDLFALVEKSRSKNSPREITGMLLFHEGKFLQLLEGPEPAVRDRYALIRRDPRHESVTVVMEGVSEERDFPEWTMGFERPDEAWSLPPAWSTILENEMGATSKTPSGAKELLLSFQHTAVRA